MALSEALCRQAVACLQSRLPRLIFAALDGFPLANGRENGLVVIAVRSLPAAERLDVGVAHVLEELARGSHRPPVQLKAQQLQMQLQDEAPVQVTVNWHDAVDFARLLQKGLPGAVEALQREPHEVLHATEEWWQLRAGVKGVQMTRCKPYLKACAGAALSLLHQKEKKLKRREGVQYQLADTDRTQPKGSDDPPALDVEKLQTIHSLASRVASEELQHFKDPCEWKPVLQRLSGVAEAAPAIAPMDLSAWCEQLRDTDYDLFRSSLAETENPLPAWQQRVADRFGLPTCQHATSSSMLDQESQEAMKEVERLVPDGSELVFLAQTGSFMYDLQVETSDMDFTLIYQALPEHLLSIRPPQEEFSRHVQQGYASDKKGVMEYTGRELGSFVVQLAKGNPKNVELLFAAKACYNWAWAELREVRGSFLTLRCAKQYLGLVSERLYRARELLRAEGGGTLKRGSEFSKLLYHAHHKMMELDRILKGGHPAVALSGREREEVLEIRLRRPGLEEAEVMLEKAEAQRAQLASDLKTVEAAEKLPPEVDAEALTQWLQSVRVRMALGVTRREMAKSPLSRTRSSEEQQAIKDLIEEVAALEKVKVVVAGYGICSRSMGTVHSKSDHDIKCIFVHPRSNYFGLHPLASTFRHHFPGAADGADVEISGWEARHALQMLSEDNPSVLGLLLSPVTFVGEEWRHRLLQTATELVNRDRLMYHWYNHARRNFQSYIKSKDNPLRKRYVHVLRPLLSVAWLRKKAAFPPMSLMHLLMEVVELGAVAPAEAEVLRRLIYPLCFLTQRSLTT